MSGVERAPSVIESPNATIADDPRPARHFHARQPVVLLRRSGERKLGRPGEVPFRRHVRRSATPSRASSGLPVSLGKYRLTARSPSAGTSRSTGSLTTTTPGIIVNDALPANVSGTIGAGTIEDPVPRLARCAAPTTTGVDPNAFDSSDPGATAADARSQNHAHRLIRKRRDAERGPAASPAASVTASRSQSRARRRGRGSRRCRAGSRSRRCRRRSRRRRVVPVRCRVRPAPRSRRSDQLLRGPPRRHPVSLGRVLLAFDVPCADATAPCRRSRLLRATVRARPA